MPSRFARGKSTRSRDAACLAVGLALLMAAPGARLDAEQPVALRGGDTAAGEATPGQLRTYTVAAQPGDYIRILVKHAGDAVGAKLFAPDGTQRAEASAGPRFRGGDVLSTVAESAGLYRIDVGPLGKTGDARRFELILDPLRPATEIDARRVQAERVFFEAELLRNQPDAGALNKAVVLYRTAVTHAEAAGDDLLLSDVLHHLALTLDYLSDYPASIAEYERALALRRSLGDRLREGETLSNMGAVYRFAGQLRRAMPYYEQAIAIRREIGDEVGESSTLHNLGTLSWNLGDYDRALDYYNHALAIRERIRLPIEAAETMIGIGTAYRARGDVQTALMYYVDALAGKRAAGDRRGEYNALQNTGVAYAAIGEYDRALSYLDEALALSRQAGDKRWESAALVSAANVRRSQGQFDEAMPLYEQALALRRGMNDGRGQGEVLSNLGLLVEMRGDARAALARYDEALALNRAEGDRRGEAGTLVNSGSAYLRLGELVNAREQFEAALALHQQIGDRAGAINALAGLARTSVAAGDLDNALATTEIAVAAIDTLAAGLAVPTLRATYFGAQEDVLSLHVDVLMTLDRRTPGRGYMARAFAASERAKARTLREVLAGAGTALFAGAGADPALVERERRLRAQVNAAERARLLLLEGRPSALQLQAAEREVETVAAQHQQVEARLRVASGSHLSAAAAAMPALDEIQRVLPADSLLIEYALGPDRSYVWAVTRDRIVSATLPPREAIETAARRAHQRLSEGSRLEARAAARTALAELSRLIIAPIAHHLGTKRLLVVADGALHYVPLTVLPDPRRPGTETPLIVAHEIVTLPSAAVIPALRARAADGPAPRRTVAVIADPVLQASDPRLARRVAPASGPEPARAKAGGVQDLKRSAADSGVPNLARLMFSGDEADEIARLAPGSSLKIVGIDAQRTRVVGDALADYRILHFATHGLLNSQRPELSGVVLSLVDEHGRTVDGFLRLNDIYHLKLNAELVVLSACRTALGRSVRGEGLIGLTRGFMSAGAPRVVASLWDVRDRATAELMKRFYTALLKHGARPAAALRQAQLSMMREPRWSAPFFWAGFILQGDWR